MELGFDSLRVSVWGKLLAGVLSDQEKRVGLRVGDFELVSAERADLLCGCVRADDQGFGSAARVPILKGDTEVILERGTKKPLFYASDRHQISEMVHANLEIKKYMQLLDNPLGGVYSQNIKPQA